MSSNVLGVHGNFGAKSSRSLLEAGAKDPDGGPSWAHARHVLMGVFSAAPPLITGIRLEQHTYVVREWRRAGTEGFLALRARIHGSYSVASNKDLQEW